MLLQDLHDGTVPQNPSFIKKGPKRPHKHKDATNHDFWYPLVLGLGTRMSDPYVYVVFWGPIKAYDHLANRLNPTRIQMPSYGGIRSPKHVGMVLGTKYNSELCCTEPVTSAASTAEEVLLLEPDVWRYRTLLAPDI